MDGCINCQHVKILWVNLTGTTLLEDMGSLLNSHFDIFDKLYLPVYQSTILPVGSMWILQVC